MDRYQETFNKLESWLIKQQWKSYDVCDVKASKFYIFLSLVTNKYKFGKYFTFPFFFLNEKYNGLIRKLLAVKKNMFPQAQALIVSGYLNMYKKTKNQDYLNKAREILQWLSINRSEGFEEYCWGQPYNWYSRKIIKANTPRATVTSQVANAFLDAYELLNDEEYLKIAESASRFFINQLNFEEDKDGDICFSYTTQDNYNVHNASMLAAAVLIRTWFHTKNIQFKQFALKAIRFTIKYQNPDGSWFYWAPPDKVVGKIDNYHTGFVLESLEDIKRYLGSEFTWDSNLEKGVSYYKENLFDSDFVPKMTHIKKYPIDIQSCAQSILTFGILAKRLPEYSDKAFKILDWTIENMYDKEGFFYYRQYKNGKINKTPYIRWAQSWMFKALSQIIILKNNA